MKKIKFTGTVDTFYFVPNCEEETVVLYLNVIVVQKYPEGKEEVLPAKRMRFVLKGAELGILRKERAVALGDEMCILVSENSEGEFSYSVGFIRHKEPIVDAKEYVKNSE